MTHKLNLWSQVYGALGRSKKTYMERALVMGGEEGRGGEGRVRPCGHFLSHLASKCVGARTFHGVEEGEQCC